VLPASECHDDMYFTVQYLQKTCVTVVNLEKWRSRWSARHCKGRGEEKKIKGGERVRCG
jgi:hypothetical protein